MKIETLLFGIIEIPNEERKIRQELMKCRRMFRTLPSRYMQAKIDCLEDAIDQLRRRTNDA